jgi:hypothetical protein
MENEDLIIEVLESDRSPEAKLVALDMLLPGMKERQAKRYESLRPAIDNWVDSTLESMNAPSTADDASDESDECSCCCCTGACRDDNYDFDQEVFD